MGDGARRRAEEGPQLFLGDLTPETRKAADTPVPAFDMEIAEAAVG